MTAGRSGLTILGRAVTHGQVLPLGSDDPVVAARAVRRALADAGRRAVDVTELVLAAPEPIDAETLATLARRALGPHGTTVGAMSLVSDALDAEALASRAAADFCGDMAAESVGIAVGLDDGGDVVALCLGRVTPARGAGSPPGVT